MYNDASAEGCFQDHLTVESLSVLTINLKTRMICDIYSGLFNKGKVLDVILRNFNKVNYRKTISDIKYVRSGSLNSIELVSCSP